MVSFIRYVRNIRRTGIRQWWHQMQYIGDAKAGTLVGTDQYVLAAHKFWQTLIFRTGSVTSTTKI